MKFIRKAYYWIRYGTLTEIVVDQLEPYGPVSEKEYTDRHGIVVGYWALGSYDPSLPHQGQEEFKIK